MIDTSATSHQGYHRCKFDEDIYPVGCAGGKDFYCSHSNYFLFFFRFCFFVSFSYEFLKFVEIRTIAAFIEFLSECQYIRVWTKRMF